MGHRSSPDAKKKTIDYRAFRPSVPPPSYLVLVGADELAGVDERVAEEVDVALLGLALAPVDVDLRHRALVGEGV